MSLKSPNQHDICVLYRHLTYKNSPFYVKYLSDNIVTDTNKFMISGIKHDGMIGILKNIKQNSNNLYVLCIGYGKKSIDKHYDAELGYGGKCKRGETFDDCIKRECYEEIGVNFKNNGTIYKQNNKLTYYVTTPSCYDKNNYINNIDTKDTKNRSKCIVYGTLNEMLELLGSCNLNHHNENITYYGLCNLNDEFMNIYENTPEDKIVTIEHRYGKFNIQYDNWIW